MSKAATRTTRRRWIATIPIRMAVLLSLATLARAQTIAPVNLADPPQGLFADDWYAVQLLGKKAGHMHAISRREGDTIHSRVDTVLKIARLHHQRAGDTDRQIIVRRTNGYHGTNFGGTSAQGIAPNRENWGDLVPHFIEVPHDDIEALATVFAEHGHRIAAVLSEPVQGAGGVHPPSDGYHEGTRRLCDQHAQGGVAGDASGCTGCRHWEDW